MSQAGNLTLTFHIDIIRILIHPLNQYVPSKLEQEKASVD
jgi:hypothetical protein